jgi:hypothetical protein
VAQSRADHPSGQTGVPSWSRVHLRLVEDHIIGGCLAGLSRRLRSSLLCRANYGLVASIQCSKLPDWSKVDPRAQRLHRLLVAPASISLRSPASPAPGTSSGPTYRIGLSAFGPRDPHSWPKGAAILGHPPLSEFAACLETACKPPITGSPSRPLKIVVSRVRIPVSPFLKSLQMSRF